MSTAKYSTTLQTQKAGALVLIILSYQIIALLSAELWATP